MVQFSHLYMTTRKTIALTKQTFVDKVMSLLFYMLPKLVIAFLSRSKCLLIIWLYVPLAVIFEPLKLKPVTFSIVSPYICHEMMELNAIILVYFLIFLITLLFLFFYKFIHFNWRLIILMLSFNHLFHSPLSLSSRGSLVPFTFCHKGGVICISEVFAISPANLDSSLCFIQSSISRDVLCI